MISHKQIKYSGHFSTELILITVQSSTTTQHLHSFEFTLVNESHSQPSVAAAVV